MIVICVDDKFDDGFEYLTIGKSYEVLDISERSYKIKADDGHIWGYAKKHFKTDIEIRNDKIDKLLL